MCKAGDDDLWRMEESKRHSKRVKERERVKNISKAYEVLERHLSQSRHRCSQNKILRAAIAKIELLMKQQHRPPPSKVHLYNARACSVCNIVFCGQTALLFLVMMCSIIGTALIEDVQV